MGRSESPGQTQALSDVAARLIASPQRLEIVQHLQHSGELTPQQLAQLVGATENAINRHVSGLLQDGWIHVTGTNTGNSRGRPNRMLALTQQNDWTAIVTELNRRSDALLPTPEPPPPHS